MFSSLPSASKIYVSSVKGRQKSATTTKRRRRRSQTGRLSVANTSEENETVAVSNELEKVEEPRKVRVRGSKYPDKTTSKIVKSEETFSGENPKTCISRGVKNVDFSDKVEDIVLFPDDEYLKTKCDVLEEDTDDEDEMKLDTLLDDCSDLDKFPLSINEDNRIVLAEEHGKVTEISQVEEQLAVKMVEIDSVNSEEKDDDVNFNDINNLDEEKGEKACTSDDMENANMLTNNCEEEDSAIQKQIQVESTVNEGAIPNVPEEIPNHIPIANETVVEVEIHSVETIRSSTVEQKSSEFSDIGTRDVCIEKNSADEKVSDEENSDIVDGNNSIVMEVDTEPTLANENEETIVYDDFYESASNQVEPHENQANTLDDASTKEAKNDAENPPTCPNRIQSPQESELSCTESFMCESRNLYQDVEFTNSTTDLDKNVYVSTDNSNIIFENSSNSVQSCHDLKNIGLHKKLRRMSLPENLDIVGELSGTLHKKSVAKQISLIDKSTTTAENVCESCKNISASSKSEETNPVKPKLATKSVSVELQGSSPRKPNALRPLAMLQARSRSYVFGSMGPTGSLLGNDELSRFFPDTKVTVFVGTWNMNGHDPPKNIDDFLLPLDIDCLPDIYAIGVQESSIQSRSDWEVLLQTTLGLSHVLFTSSSLGVLHLTIFLRRDLIWFCSVPEEANVTTRPGSMVKTKGAVAVSFMFFGTSFLFVNSHLTAHEQKMKERLSDYEKIISNLDLPKQIPLKSYTKTKDVTSRFDCVFWCGDLNFRVTHDRPSVLSFVEQKVRKSFASSSFLIKHDQLHKAMAEGAAFQGFREGVINFIPSYKFDVGTNTFDSTKHRVPSYTDRILYRSKERSSISCLNYNAASDIMTSDHKPVFGIYKVSLKPGRDNVPLAAGMFKRDIYIEAIKRRAKFLEVGSGQSTICSVM